MRGALIWTAGLTLAVSTLLIPSSPPTAPGFKRADIRLVELHAIAFDRGPELPIEGSPARVDLAANRLIFPQKVVHLWVQFDPPSAPGSAFVINGLVFPEIELHAGTRLEVTFLVENTRYTADFLIANRPPPFPPTPVSPDPYKYNFRQYLPGSFRGLHAPPARFRGNGYTVYGARLVYDLRSTGEAWYVNNFVGAANTGEYGRIVVVP